MIKNLFVNLLYNAPSSQKLCGDFPVLSAGMDMAGGMIVAHDHSGSPVRYDVSEDFPRVDDSPSPNAQYPENRWRDQP